MIKTNEIVMTAHRYRQHHTTPIKLSKTIVKRELTPDEYVGHGDHWAIVGADSDKLQTWLGLSLDGASVPQGLSSAKTCDEYLVVGANSPCHIKQVFALENAKPVGLKTIFPAVDSPYGLECVINEVIVCDDTQEAILHLTSTDGTTLYAFDQLYAINHCHYQAGQVYYVNLSGWAYGITLSDQDEVILVDDPKAIRYHRAFSDIVAKNDGQVPSDIDEQIRHWQTDDVDLAPVEINMGHSCIYLFGETIGQQDEAWCQGQVLGKSETDFFGQAITLFDVVILREQDAKPFVVRLATPTTSETHAIQVQDYVQANIWLQASIFAKTQQ